MEETNLKLWGLVNLFSDPNNIALAKGIINTSYNKNYGQVTTISEGAVFKFTSDKNFYFRDLDEPIEQFKTLTIKVPEDTWLLYYKHSGKYYSMYNKQWDVMAVRILNELEYFDYVYHN